ncbi:zinc-finger domain-containing protein [Phaeovulum sp.]|uniref:zinc-finger domain-containing protein n=1 Tax=Phaeovulum sp. TaxID=2934796 RepID=UPI003521336D
MPFASCPPLAIAMNMTAKTQMPPRASGAHLSRLPVAACPARRSRYHGADPRNSRQNANGACPMTLCPETEKVTSWTVACSGGTGADGHPRVYLVIPPGTGEVTCGYCGKRFVIDREHAQADH